MSKQSEGAGVFLGAKELDTISQHLKDGDMSVSGGGTGTNKKNNSEIEFNRGFTHHGSFAGTGSHLKSPEHG